MSDEYWVIEGIGPVYWDGSIADRSGFTCRHEDAVMFRRARDAAKLIAWLFPSDMAALLKPVQHGTM